MYHVSLSPLSFLVFSFFLFECRIVVPPSPLDSNIPRSYFNNIITTKISHLKWFNPTVNITQIIQIFGLLFHEGLRFAFLCKIPLKKKDDYSLPSEKFKINFDGYWRRFNKMRNRRYHQALSRWLHYWLWGDNLRGSLLILPVCLPCIKFWRLIVKEIFPEVMFEYFTEKVM